MDMGCRAEGLALNKRTISLPGPRGKGWLCSAGVMGSWRQKATGDHT